MDIVCKCGSFNDINIKIKDEFHIGAYCNKCGKWIKWLSKSEYSQFVTEVATIEDTSNDLVDKIEIDIVSLEKQKQEIDAKIKQYYRAKLEKEIAANSGYVGKTYKKIFKDNSVGYYKIISVDKNNKYRMNTICFTLPVTHFSTSLDMFNDTCLLSFESIGWFCTDLANYGSHSKEIDNYTEISNKEFITAFDTWNAEIKNIINNMKVTNL